MDPLAITALALEILKLGTNIAEAAQAGDAEKVKEYLSQVSKRVQAAEDAWDAAARPGDDIG